MPRQNKKNADVETPDVGIARTESSLVANCAYRASVNASAAIDAVIGVDRSFFPCFADGAYRAGIVTSAAIDAVVGNSISQNFHPLRLFLT
jgi:hypothetical protein